jgi:hypothetical protein
VLDRRRRARGVDGMDYDALDDDLASPLRDRNDPVDRARRLDDEDDIT